MSKLKLDTVYREMLKSDLPMVCDIERMCFEFPWEKSDFVACLRDRNAMNILVEVEDEIIGYFCFRKDSGQIEILNIALDPNFRRQGIGSNLLVALKRSVDMFGGKEKIVACVRESNLTAQLWLRHNGFLATKIEKQSYSETYEDSYLFEYSV